MLKYVNSVSEKLAMHSIHHNLQGNTSSPICLVFIHGMFCDQSNWSAQIEYFKTEYQVLALDLPGHGQSSVPANQQWDVMSLALNLKQVLSELHLNKNWVLIAHSASVRIALELNYLLKKEVLGMVLLDCGFQKITYPDPKQWLFDLRQKGYTSWLKQFFCSKFGLRSPVLREKLLQDALGLNPGIGEALYVAVKNYDYFALEKCLALTIVPVLVIQASFYKNGTLQSASTKLTSGSDWLSLVKSTVSNARIQIMPDCGHWVMLEQPDLCNQMLEEFIQQQVINNRKVAAKLKAKQVSATNFDLPL